MGGKFVKHIVSYKNPRPLLFSAVFKFNFIIVMAANYVLSKFSSSSSSSSSDGEPNDYTAPTCTQLSMDRQPCVRKREIEQQQMEEEEMLMEVRTKTVVIII